MFCRAYVVNIPGFFSLLWRIAEPLTPPATRKRLRVLRSKEVDPLRFVFFLRWDAQTVL
jgi:hypothetical protein